MKSTPHQPVGQLLPQGEKPHRWGIEIFLEVKILLEGTFVSIANIPKSYPTHSNLDTESPLFPGLSHYNESQPPF